MLTKTHPISKPVPTKSPTVPQIDALAVHQSETAGEVLESVAREQVDAAKVEMEQLMELFRRAANQD